VCPSPVGAVGLEDGNDLFNRWYAADGDGGVRLTVPPEVAAGEAAEEAGPSRGGSPVRTLEPGGDLRPARPEVVTGDIHGVKLRQHDFTKEQYDALGCLLASLCNIFPRVRPTYPRDKGGKLVTTKLADDELANFEGLVGHYHVQTNKIDPGPAFQWDHVAALVEVGALAEDFAASAVC